MKTFIAVVHKDPGSAYGIRFPEVPGCYSAADDFNDVLPNAVEALSLHFEDQPPPDPRDLDELSAEVADEIAEGAALIAVPLIVPTRTSARVNISLDRGTLAAIDASARARARPHPLRLPRRGRHQRDRRPPLTAAQASVALTSAIGRSGPRCPGTAASRDRQRGPEAGSPHVFRTATARK